MKERLRETIEEEAKMDMTPMIDVVFLLIIFFLCIDFRILEAKLPAYLPKDVGAHTTEVEPQEKLNIMIICDNFGTKIPRRQATAQEAEAGIEPSYRLEGHQVRWKIGPTPFQSSDALLEALRKIATDTSRFQRDKETGELKPMSVVIEPGPDTTYGDVATTLDAVREAGFEDISFGGGLGARGARGARSGE